MLARNRLYGWEAKIWRVGILRLCCAEWGRRHTEKTSWRQEGWSIVNIELKYQFVDGSTALDSKTGRVNCLYWRVSRGSFERRCGLRLWDFTQVCMFLWFVRNKLEILTDKINSIKNNFYSTRNRVFYPWREFRAFLFSRKLRADMLVHHLPSDTILGRLVGWSALCLLYPSVKYSVLGDFWWEVTTGKEDVCLRPYGKWVKSTIDWRSILPLKFHHLL